MRAAPRRARGAGAARATTRSSARTAATCSGVEVAGTRCSPAGDDDYIFEGDTRGAGDWDVLDGGAGEDWLGYATHDEDLFADLRSTGQQITAVPEGALDDVRGFESLHTGSGDDTIIGEGSAHATIASGPGDDLVHAGPGKDEVSTGKGDDRVLAAGDDLLRDYIECGPGRDSVVAETGDRVHAMRARRSAHRPAAGHRRATQRRAAAPDLQLLRRDLGLPRIRECLLAYPPRMAGRPLPDPDRLRHRDGALRFARPRRLGATRPVRPAHARPRRQAGDPGRGRVRASQ